MSIKQASKGNKLLTETQLDQIAHEEYYQVLHIHMTKVYLYIYMCMSGCEWLILPGKSVIAPRMNAVFHKHVQMS